MQLYNYLFFHRILQLKIEAENYVFLNIKSKKKSPHAGELFTATTLWSKYY